jgi:two-component system, NtrC family, sensor histidine kinase HydH
MWKTVLPPIVLVVVIWVLTSASTTYYLLWLDNSYEHALAKNFHTIQAVDSIQNIVARTLFDLPEQRSAVESFAASWPEVSTGLNSELGKLKAAALGQDQAEVQQFIALVEQFIRTGSDISVSSSGAAHSELVAERLKVRETGLQVTESAQQLQSFNYQMLNTAATQRKNIQGYVFVGRTLLLIAGPALGVWLGWKLSKRLHRSVAKLAVTLGDASTHLEKYVASVELRPHSDLGDVQIQADHIVNRIREVIQELDAVRREVLQAERLAAVGGLAAGVAHELRNPLTSIKLLLQHASRHSGAVTLQENKTKLILEEISKMESTIQGLLDFARPPELDRIRHDLRTTLNRGLNLIDGRCRQQQIKVTTLFCDVPLWVHGNAEQLNQVFVNLLINAIEAMPRGGSLSVLAGHAADGTVVRVEVSDTGEGINGGTLSRLFEPFVTTKEKGTGLGLAISRRIIDAHNGAIRAANRLEGGAIFTVEIPVSEYEPSSGEVAQLCTQNAVN